MCSETLPYDPILIALPDWMEPDFWRQLLESQGFSVLVAKSLEMTLTLVQSHQLHCIVTNGEWATVNINSEFGSLVKITKGKIPILAFVSSKDKETLEIAYNQIDEIYSSPLNDYCWLPTTVNQVVACLKRIKLKTNGELGG